MWIYLAFLALYVFWGSTYLGIHYLLVGGFTPFLGAGIRMGIAGGLLLAYVRLRGLPGPSLREMRELAVAGGFLFVGGNGLVMLAQQSLPSGLAATLIATTPFWMTGLERFVPGSARPSVVATAGIAIGFAGVAVLLGPRLSGGSNLAIVCILLAPILWSIGGLWAKHRLRGVPPLTVTAYEMLFAAMMLGAVGWVRGEAPDLAPTATGYLALAYLVVFGSLFGFSAFVYLMAKVPSAKVATYSYVNPVIAVFLGWAIASETLTVRSLLGTAVIVIGVSLVNLPVHRVAGWLAIVRRG
jgi:drug/metabolite transporter (DMT)-like permease